MPEYLPSSDAGEFNVEPFALQNWGEGLVNLHTTEMSTTSHGPGSRFSLWVQHCAKRCPGCCNAQMLKARVAQLKTVKQLQHEISLAVNSVAPIEGVTLQGGEPFLQAETLAPLLAWVKHRGLNTLVFSGYTREFLAARQVTFNRVFALIAACQWQ